MTPRQAQEFLFALPRFAVSGAVALKPGLERIKRLLAEMGNPHEKYDSVLVAGTNGKGSTASMLAAILTASGKRTALHTSPHLLSVTERMRINGIAIPENQLATMVSRYRGLIEDIQPSFFEATVALSFLYFAEENVDIAIVEVGLGGRLDATNILPHRLGLITRIALDHQDTLGNTLAEIAREKAGIARSGGSILSAHEIGEASRAIEDEVVGRGGFVEHIRETTEFTILDGDSLGSDLQLMTPERAYPRLRVGIGGKHQAWNASLAVRAAEHLGIGEEAIRKGTREVSSLTGLAGRTQIISTDPFIMVDVSHNPDGIQAALEFFAERVPGKRTVFLGLMADKDAPAIARLLADYDVNVAVIPLEGERATAPEKLATVLRAAGVRVVGISELGNDLDFFHSRGYNNAGVLVVGSHILAARVISKLTRQSR